IDRVGTARVGTDALVCPAERSSASSAVTATLGEPETGTPVRLSSTRDDRIGYSRRLDRKAHIVGSDDVCALQDQKRFGRQRSVKPIGHARILTVARQQSPNECLPRHSRHQWKSRLLHPGEVRHQWIILLEALSESK